MKTKPASQPGIPNPRQLATAARALAVEHLQATGTQSRSRSLIPVVTASGDTLTQVYDTFARAAVGGDSLTAGAHWILDHFYLLRDQRTEVLKHLRGKFFSELPQLPSGPQAGRPRVYDVVLQLLEAVDYAVDSETLVRFLAAYQSVCPLKLGELWAVPDSLRAGLLHVLSDIATDLRDAHVERGRATEWAARILNSCATDPVEGIWQARSMLEGGEALSEAFVWHLVEQLQGTPSATPVVEWLERRLASRSTSVREIARVATQREVSVAHAVSTLRWASSARWDPIVEAVSLTERELRKDPARVHARMDFATRDRYRHVVEELSRRSGHSEVEVARLAVDMAGEADKSGEGRHIGYHLIGPGARELESRVGYRPPIRRAILRLAYRRPKTIYLGVVAALTVLFELGISVIADAGGVSFELLVLVLLTALLPCAELAVSFTNRLVAWIVPPRPLPKMNKVAGVGPDSRTLVAVPTLLRSAVDATAQVKAVEVHARSNPSPFLRFALLTDFADSPDPVHESDDETLLAAQLAIRALNERERDEWGDRYFLLHRGREWNESEGVWMGWERKRGKLEHLNLLLRRGSEPTSYSTIEGNFEEVVRDDQIRFVITLDADTQLPPESAIDLIRTATHPLNHPVLDEGGGRVIRGYGILQPRVSISPRSAARSWFARVFSGNVGLDPYTTAVSDAYQDLFGEGIYTGKGLYVVDAFRTVLDGVVPTDTVLSHDLLESTFARAALVTDVEVFDDYPGDFISYSKRLHRWVRGDWQIARWLLPRTRDREGRLRRNPITVLGRWQILDNIRRSLTPPAMLLFLLAGWIALPRSPLFWTGVALAILFFPVYVNLTAAVFSRPHSATWFSHLRGVGDDVRTSLVQTALATAFIAHTGLHNLDAIGRTVWRMAVSKRRRLQWTAAQDVERGATGSAYQYVRFMWSSPVWAGVGAVLVGVLEPRAWIAAAPFLVAWLAAPWIAWLLRRPVRRRTGILSSQDRVWLRSVARATWSYFEHHVSEATSWLPPDNVQEFPFRGAAPRTSPTNIGLGLLSTQSALDLGWLGRDQLLRRLEDATSTIDRLDSYAGHLYNWYDTQTRETLWPKYVSTVDSGNYAASLIALAQGLLHDGSPKWPNPQYALGVAETLALANDQRGLAEPENVSEVLSRCTMALQDVRSDTLISWWSGLEALHAALEGLQRPRPSESPSDHALLTPNDLQDLRPSRDTLLALAEFVDSQRAELSELLPWLKDGKPLPAAVARVDTLDALGLALEQRAVNDSRAAAGLRAFRSRESLRDSLVAWCMRSIERMDFSVVYNRREGLFSVGYDLESHRRDSSHYDLLASEARLASYIAVARGEVPVSHWFRLGRRATEGTDGSVLLSWSGTMFEYLMPLLFTDSGPDTLLDESYHNAVMVQERYAKHLGRPWGISESAYNALNLSLDYQYRAFGVPGLGLKRGLGEDYVVAPYASALALMVFPSRATRNLRRLNEEGAFGAYGFYDAVDYTRSRLPPGEDKVVVQTWMAHHQAMTLLSLSNVLDSKRVQRRFQSSSLARAAELLIQERIPSRIRTIDPHPMEATVDPGDQDREAPPVIHAPEGQLSDPSPRGGLLSNGRYSVLLTQAGTGSSRFNEWTLTRWTPDRVTDPNGVFFYLRDLDSGSYWSITPKPTSPATDRLDTWFHLSKVESALVHDWLESFVEVCVSPEDDVEVRRITITNYGPRTRRLDLTSYVEIVLNQGNADQAHPAFSKLFVETEALPEHHALLATRRPREHDADRMWMFHTLTLGTSPTEVAPHREFETDRMAFIGRGRTLTRPVAMEAGGQLTEAVGPVLDPIFSIRQPFELKPQESAVINFTLGVAQSRDEAIALADRYDNPTATQRVIDLATAYGPVETAHLAISGEEALRLQALGTAMLYGDPRIRGPKGALERNRKQQSGLWGYGISGDVPLMVIRVHTMDHLNDVRRAVRAFEYWRLKGLDTDLVFLNQHPPSYLEGVQDRIAEEIQMSSAGGRGDYKGGIHALRADQVPEDDVNLLLTVARAVFDLGTDELFTIPDASRPDSAPTLEQPATPALDGPNAAVRSEDDDDIALEQDNGFGGFAPDNSYVITSSTDGANEATPLPWINVVANPHAGFVASEAGGGFSWSINSHENRLSPWSNDPVSDRPAEVVYVRDETRGEYGSVTPSPVPLPGSYRTRHSFGHTTYHHQGEDLEHELTLFMADQDPVKIMRLRIRNRSAEKRDLSVFHYHEWVLGIIREDAAPHVVTERDEQSGGMLAWSHYNQEFAGRVAFSKAILPPNATVDASGDRASFLGRGNDVDHPDAVAFSAELDEKFGAGLDPCSAWRVALALDPGQEVELAFLLGECPDAPAARVLIDKYGSLERINEELDSVVDAWKDRLGGIEVSTPSPVVNRVLDGWMMYQSLACRMWGRSAFYQSGGAYGFRDQLQDAMSLIYVDPELTREQIVLHAAHQFVEGDVLHWWHPPGGRGVRTKFSDDLLWLPFVVAFYVGSTGDLALLDEGARYLQARPLEEEEQEAYLHPDVSDQSGDIYDHCCRAIDRSLTSGDHGLPLMGAGDWNDGMNRVGLNGGESVWLGFFLYKIIGDFVPFCAARGDDERLERYSQYRQVLGEALNEEGWDGEWYRRAFYGDGTPLGSTENEECRIDAIAQAWSVISGVAPSDRAHSALDAVAEHLYDAEGGLIRLLTPPFDHSDKDPGYIKGYLPGVRENGGQYTHGVLWAIQAMAEMGDVDRALRLFEAISPSTRAATRDGARRYKVEPYVSAADVYSVPPHVGRGGWTWYTGSAGWMVRVALESLLGFRLRDGDIELRPHLPSQWPGYRMTYRPTPDTEYVIAVRTTDGEPSATLDGVALTFDGKILRLPAPPDGVRHDVEVQVPSASVP